jgi:hypothetical protein
MNLRESWFSDGISVFADLIGKISSSFRKAPVEKCSRLVQRAESYLFAERYPVEKGVFPQAFQQTC